MPQTRDAVLSNPLYQNITSRFVHSHDYLAMEQLHDLHATGDYDLVVVDTPPSRNALSVLDAPSKMIEFFGSRLLRWLTVPYRSRLFTMASKPFYQVADRVLGSGFLRDIADFFVLFQAMEKGFVARAREVEALLGDPRTTFLVVSTLETAPAHEAAFLARELLTRDYDLGAIVANRVLPARSPAGARRPAPSGSPPATEGDALVGAVAAELGAHGAAVDTRVVGDVLAEVAARFHDVALVATREAERRAELAALAPAGARRARRWTPTSTTSPGCSAWSVTCAADEDRADSTPMASLAALVRDNTTLDRDQVSHLNRLMSEWGMLADFCFADLLLYVPTKDERWLIVGQVRPATGQTVYHTDWVGSFANVSEHSVLGSAFTSGEITEGDVRVEDLPDSARMLAVPVRCDGPADRRADPRVGPAVGPPAGRAGAHVRVDLRPLRRDDRRGLVPVPGARRRLGDGPAGRRRRDEPRRRGPRPLPVAERQLGAAPRRHPRQRRRDAPGRARLPRRHGAQGLRAAGARSSRSSSRRRTSPCCAAACRSWPTARSPAACCSCVTSPTCASGTGC